MQELGGKAEIDDTFFDEHALAASQYLIPWFADFSNNLASDIVPSNFSFHKRKKFIHDVKNLFGMRHIYIGVVPTGLFDVACQKSRC